MHEEHATRALVDRSWTAPESAIRPLPRLRPVSAGPHRWGRLTALSEPMRRVFELMYRLAVTDVTVSLVGETGTGKDVLARALHEQSPRAAAPFVVFDCSAVAANLAESELFGHERGSFTGAVTSHVGAFERAQGGTLFLDEIGELPIDLQPRLLRALENRTVRRVGGTQERAVDVRIVAATNRDLPADVASGTFRQDLFFRLAGAVVPVPALRERRDDIPGLVPTLLADLGHPEITASEGAIEKLRGHPWPGNVRELKNTLACALAFVDGPLLEARHLTFVTPPAAFDENPLERLPLAGQSLARIERAAIKQTLQHTRGNKSLAARELGIAVSTLYEKLKKHGL